MPILSVSYGNKQYPAGMQAFWRRHFLRGMLILLHNYYFWAQKTKAIYF